MGTRFVVLLDMLKDFTAYQLAVQFFKSCEKVRGERYLKDQLMRASSSIALNLAEGSERGSDADQRRFYRMAMGSTRECQAILDLLETKGATQEAALIGDRTAAAIFRLCKSIDQRISQRKPRTENRAPRTENGS